MIAALLPLLLLTLGTIGYRVIEGWSYHDSLYMTVITLTTVGYREVHPLSRAGEIFTMVLALGGVFTLFYATASVIAGLVSGQILDLWGSRRMERNLASLEGHVIVCGYGRMGRLACQEFAAQESQFVVIDRDEELLAGFQHPRGIALRGDATSDETLVRAGIKRAKALISAVSSDADNLYITMSARLLNERLFIVSRAEDDSSGKKLLRAGASRVVSPYAIGAARLAQAVLRPAVVDFLELATRSEHLELNIEETKISPTSRLAGSTLETSGVRHEYGLIIVAIKKPSGHMLFNPSRDAVLEAGDVLIMLGRRQDLDQVDAMAGS